ncbi:MAG: hypothetical protein LBL93_06395 [Ruminococcus sp.]|jgi:hypothetical protein|nr:hypothetical protein [Ruminococcus sp.]
MNSKDWYALQVVERHNIENARWFMCRSYEQAWNLIPNFKSGFEGEFRIYRLKRGEDSFRRMENGIMTRDDFELLKYLKWNGKKNKRS